MGVLNPIFSKIPNAWQAIVCLLLTVGYSVIFAFLYTRGKRLEGYYKDTPIAFIILPVVISGLTIGVGAISYNIGTGTTSDIIARYGRVAVALLSALVILKFRSEERTPEVLTYYLFLIAIGVLTGTGYLMFSFILYAFIVILFLAIHILRFPRISRRRLTLKITIPEDLNYEHAFDDIFSKYTEVNELVRIKSSDLGTLFVVRYEIVMKKGASQKKFLDDLRTRNSNLDILLVSNRFNCKD